MADELRKDGISLEETVTAAVEEFYREATKTVVKVDNASLEKIRQEALATQERLIVPEEPLLQSAVLPLRHQPQGLSLCLRQRLFQAVPGGR